MKDYGLDRYYTFVDAQSLIKSNETSMESVAVMEVCSLQCSHPLEANEIATLSKRTSLDVMEDAPEWSFLSKVTDFHPHLTNTCFCELSKGK